LKLPPLEPTKKALVLLLVGLLVGFHPVLRHRLPRSSEAWSHLENIGKIPSAADAANFGKMLELFENRQHYTKYPLFYVIGKLLSIESPFSAAAFSAIVFAFLPLLMFLLARSVLDDLEAFVCGLVVAVTSAFVYTMNFFSGGEPLAVALLLIALTLHLRRGPLAALALYIAIIFLHPFTSLLLWTLLVVLPFFSRPDAGRRAIEQALCTGIFSLAFLGWMLLQISAGLPLGDYIGSSLGQGTLVAAFAVLTLGSLMAQVLRRRFGPLGRAIAVAVRSLQRSLPTLIVLLELIFLVLFVVAGVPGTEQIVRPCTALFYLPLLAAIGMVGLRRREVEPFTVAFVSSVIALFLAGILIFPKGIPAYRLAPYGAMGLSLMLAPCISQARGRLLLPLVLAGLAATAYPGPSFYFGFDEQYYPSELAAVTSMPHVTVKGCVLSDVRMEDFIRYETGLEPTAPEAGPVDLGSGCVALLTNQIRRQGFYPPGHEWFRHPFKLDLSGLEAESMTVYDNGWAEIIVVGENKVSLGLVSD